jgi:hypothetical protein
MRVPPKRTVASMAVAVAVAAAVGLGARALFGHHGEPRKGARVGAGAGAGAGASAGAGPGTGGRVLPEEVLHVPHLPGTITLDGDTDDPGWTQPPGPARTGPFSLANGAEARPYSDARMLWGDGHLYLALYASDEDIRTRTTEPDGPLWLDDSFRVTFRRGDDEYSIEVSPKGVVTDAARRAGGTFDYSWQSGVHVSPELDGTMNQPGDMDEEWVIEMAVPFEALGMKGERGERVGIAIRRCDTPKGQPRVCGSWGEGDVRERLVLD